MVRKDYANMLRVLLAVSGCTGTEMLAQTAERRVVKLSSLCLLQGRPRYATVDYVRERISEACERDRPDLLVTPFLPFVSFREGSEEADLAPFAELAAAHKTILVVALIERRRQGGVSHSSVILDRSGKVAGSYRKAHALPDDDGIVLGDDLPVFKTDVGTIGLSVTSDFYFPETYWVQRMKGAEILVWQHAPERFRQHFEWVALLKARCLDAHAHMLTAMYSDERTYITNRYGMGMQGAPWGRSMVLNRVGTAVADTGYEDGVATASVDLDKRKTNVYAPFMEAENIFFCNCLGDRSAFTPLCRHTTPAPLPKYAKRSARIAVGCFPPADMWRAGVMPETMLRVIDRAAALKPDLLLLAEMAVKASDDVARKAIAQVSARAKAMRCYIVIGGVQDDTATSVARVWDREGKEIFGEPIYWTKGFPEIKVFDTDFCRVGIHTCGDLYTGEIDRVLTVKGAELILDPSQHWGADGHNNELMLRARAAENGTWVACAHWNTSDAGLRSLIADPYGYVVAGTQFQKEDVVFADVDFADLKVYYAARKADQPTRGESGIPSYYTEDCPEQRPGWREMILSRRRPELYSILPTVNSVIMKYRPEQGPWH